MRQTNRVEPENSSGGELTRATMTTTTHLEIIRRVEVVPIVSEFRYYRETLKSTNAFVFI
jgi:hypothetical protein